MTFCIITHVVHKKHNNHYYGYAPYIREMNIWLKYTNKVIVVAPLIKEENSVIDLAYAHQDIDFRKIKEFDITTIKNIFLTLLAVPTIAWQIFRAMQASDHIHLRCPGNIGLLGCLIQILFPKKKKTAKYAGNWNPNSPQPISYRIQKWILSNTFLTKNMQVLVYGEWSNQTHNIKPFFTATFSENEKKSQPPRDWTGKIRLLFAGSLFEGKRPLYAVQVAEQLYKQGMNVTLELCGEGLLRVPIENYIKENNLDTVVFLRGNLSKNDIIEKYQDSHFLLLPSKSEGWPKVLAEAMFWGCVPVATNVSCVNNMIDAERRGILLSMDVNKDTQSIISHIINPIQYQEKSEKALSWSREFTVEKFENEIRKLL